MSSNQWFEPAPPAPRRSVFVRWPLAVLAAVVAILVAFGDILGGRR